MVVVCDRYTDDVQQMQVFLRRMGMDAVYVVLEDDGFLPGDAASPYGYFVLGQNENVYPECEKHFNFIEIPRFWEIRGLGSTGGIYDMSCKKASVYFREPLERRNVERVEWQTESGWIYKVDYYNKYGMKYAGEFRGTDGETESRVFYSDQNQEVIVEQPQNGVITLFHEGKVRACFDSYPQFIEYYLDERELKGKRILLIQDKKWMERLELGCGRGSGWSGIWFREQEHLNEYIGMGGTNGHRFYGMPADYPENQARKEALILTMSDQIEGIGYLIEALPGMQFHIAANTMVSEKLARLAEKPNVKVYPQIDRQVLESLWKRCGFYLDINYYREIYDAVCTAHRKNLLIMGFENTLHGREFMAQECIFPPSDPGKMIDMIRRLCNDPRAAQEMLVRQQGKRTEMLEELWRSVAGSEE